jgi:hypothetical protein
MSQDAYFRERDRCETERAKPGAEDPISSPQASLADSRAGTNLVRFAMCGRAPSWQVKLHVALLIGARLHRGPRRENSPERPRLHDWTFAV